MRLGFSVSVVGRPGLRSHDGRRWQNRPHLSVSLAYLRDLFLYLDSQRICMYRLSTDLAPYLTHPAFPEFHHQIEACEAELAAAGDQARRVGLRLSFHAGAHVVLNSADELLTGRATAELCGLASLLAAMRMGTEAVIVVHVGASQPNNRQAALEAFCRGFESLPPAARARVVLEHDDRLFGVCDCLWVHARTGVRLVFDLLHHQLHNPTGLHTHQALAVCLDTWPAGQTPKIHVATPATELVRDRRHWPHPPRLNRHSAYLNPFPVIDFLRALPAVRDFDVMLEARAKDLALLQLRQHLGVYAPDLVERYGIA